MYHSIEELKELVAKRLTLDELLDVLGMDMQDVVDLLEEAIYKNQEEVEEACKQ